MGQSDYLTILHEARTKGWSDQALVQRAIEMARALCVPVQGKLSAEERVFLAAVSRLVADEPSRRFVAKLCERVLNDSPQAIDTLKQMLAEHGGAPTFFSSIGRLRIKAATLAPRSMQATALGEVKRVFHATFGEITLPPHIGKLSRRAEALAKEGITLALTPLSPEPALGSKAAAEYERRLRAILEKQASAGLVVQPWRLCPQMDPCSPGRSAEELANSLISLLRPAASGSRTVILASRCSDTLPIIVEAYKRVMDHPDYAQADIALELPGYLHTSLQLLRELIDWATPRASKGAKPIKTLLVKGSHLEEERRCGAVYGSGSQLCRSKTEAEVAFTRLINAAIAGSPKAITPIIGTHELTHLCYAVLRWARSGREGMLPLCLTYGLGNHLARQFAKLGSPAILTAGIAADDAAEGQLAFHRHLHRVVRELSRPGGFLSAGYAAGPSSVDWNDRARPLLVACSSDAPAGSVSAPAGAAFTPGDLAPLLDRAYVDAFYAAARAEAERSQAPLPLVVNGEPAQSPLTFIHRSLTVPGLEDYRFTSADYPAVENTLRAAAAAVATPRGSEAERADALRRAARALRKRSTEFAALLARDAGCTMADAQAELRDAIDALRYYASELLSNGLQDGSTPRPLGVVVVAADTAHPLSGAVGGIAPAWLAGNSIIYKPAAYSTLLATRLTELLTQAGVSLLCLPCVDNEIGARLMTDPRVDALLCNATPAQAHALAAKAPHCSIISAPAWGPPIYLAASCDWRLALRDIIRSSMRRSGQSPAAPHIFIVHADVYDAPGFLPTLQDAVGSLTPMPTWLEGASLGPLASPLSAEARELLTDRREGDEWLLPPHAAELGSLLWAPGICAGVRHGSALATHGQKLPLIALLRVQDTQEAIDHQRLFAQGSRAIIYTQNSEEAATWQRDIGCAWMAVNCCPALRHGSLPTPAWPTAQHAATSPFIGGRHFAAALCRWHESTRPTMRSARRNIVFDPKGIFPTTSNAEDTMRLSAAADSISYWWEQEFGTQHTEELIPGCRVTRSYRPIKLCLRIEKEMSDTDIAILLMVTMQAGCSLQLSMAAQRPWVALFAEQYNIPLITEKRPAFIDDFPSLAAAGVTVRDTAALEDTLAAAARARLPLIADSVLANARLEFLHCTSESTLIEGMTSDE